ncbi:MAG: hypothetical protein APF84_12325 [Gracilibacter sp. BRH_c7a]|nr:MAG: hypothetical protein APF84_12325 [Gracilibacter sp. BRH_c7a]
MEAKWVSQEVCDERHRAVETYLDYNKNAFEKQTEEIMDIKEAIVRLTTLIERHDSELEDHELRIRNMEAKPGKKWDNLMIQIGSLLTAAVIGGFIGNTF